MVYRLLNRLVIILYRLKLDVLVDIFKTNYNKKKVLDLIHSFKSAGPSFSIGINYSVINPRYISFGENFSALSNFRIEAWDYYQGEKFLPQIEIGNNVIFNTDCHVGCINKVVIGNNVLIASRVYISDHSHGEINLAAVQTAPTLRPLISKGPVIIEDNVWIGEGACIMPGITIGRNSIIGANSVVTKDVLPNTVVGGLPARLIKNLI